MSAAIGWHPIERQTPDDTFDILVCRCRTLRGASHGWPVCRVATPDILPEQCLGNAVIAERRTGGTQRRSLRAQPTANSEATGLPFRRLGRELHAQSQLIRLWIAVATGNGAKTPRRCVLHCTVALRLADSRFLHVLCVGSDGSNCAPA